MAFHHLHRLRRALPSSYFLLEHCFHGSKTKTISCISASRILPTPAATRQLMRRPFTSTTTLLHRVFNPETDEIGPDTILFEGCDYNHWLITVDFPKDSNLTREQMIETYVDIAAQVFGSVEEAKKKIYALSTTTYVGFQVECSEETSEKFKSIPGVVFVLPDSYIDPVNKEYGGDKYVNGEIFPRPPPVHYGRRSNRDRRPSPQQNYGPPSSQQQNYGPPSSQHNYVPPSSPSSQHNYVPPPPPQHNYGPPPSQKNYVPPPPQQNYGPPPQQNYGPPPSQKNYVPPPPQQNYGPPPQQNYGPPPSQHNYVPPPPQQNYGPPPQQNYGPSPQQNYGPPPQRNYGPPSQQNYGPATQQNHGSSQHQSYRPLQQGYTPQPHQTYGPPSPQPNFVPNTQGHHGNSPNFPSHPNNGPAGPGGRSGYMPPSNTSGHDERNPASSYQANFNGENLETYSAQGQIETQSHARPGQRGLSHDANYGSSLDGALRGGHRNF